MGKIFNSVRSKLTLAVLGMFVAIFIMFIISNAALRNEILQEQLKSEGLIGSINLLQSDLDAATITLTRLEQEKRSLREELAFVSKLYRDLVSMKSKIDERLNNQLNQAKDYIKGSNDETVIRWAGDNVPFDLNKLLKQAAYCSDSSNREDKVCSSADGINWKLQAAGVQRENES